VSPRDAALEAEASRRREHHQERAPLASYRSAMGDGILPCEISVAHSTVTRIGRSKASMVALKPSRVRQPYR
jgi:hypothetical protein